MIRYSKSLGAGILALLLALFAPFPALLIAAQGPDSSCKMVCKRVDSCCCKKHHIDSTGSWAAARTCPKGCVQLPGLAAPHAFEVRLASRFVSPSLVTQQIPAIELDSRRAAGVDFALFERPPPAA